MCHYFFWNWKKYVDSFCSRSAFQHLWFFLRVRKFIQKYRGWQQIYPMFPTGDNPLCLYFAKSIWHISLTSHSNSARLSKTDKNYLTNFNSHAPKKFTPHNSSWSCRTKGIDFAILTRDRAMPELWAIAYGQKSRNINPNSNFRFLLPV